MMNKVIKMVGQIFGYKFSVTLVMLLALVVLSALVTTSLVRSNPEMLGLLKGREILLKEEVAFVARVSESIALPRDERPTVATVTDPEKLEGQSFFASSKQGDKILVYPEAGKVILYRPSEDRVVEVGTINIQEEVLSEVEVLLKVALLNGTADSSALDDLEDRIGENVVGVEVVSRADAVGNYNQAVVVALSEEGKKEVEIIASELGMEIGEMPEGESVSEGVDVAIIWGNGGEEDEDNSDS